MAENPFSTLRGKIGDTERSFQWYKTEITKLRGITTNKLMSNKSDLVSRILPGKMYMYHYDPKLKDILPVYDTFPLVLPFSRVSDGFYGINLHYMPYMSRFKLLSALHEFATDEKMNEDTKVRASWTILKTMARVAPIKPSVKRYLYEYVESRFLEIKYPDWTTAAMLPVERFVKQTKQQVWRNATQR